MSSPIWRPQWDRWLGRVAPTRPPDKRDDRAAGPPAAASTPLLVPPGGRRAARPDRDRPLPRDEIRPQSGAAWWMRFMHPDELRRFRLPLPSRPKAYRAAQWRRDQP
jgi:hypothetical protein